jgi:hypothetical protein
MVGAAVAVAVLCPVARASYTVYGCALPTGAPAPLDGWTLSATAYAIAQNRCEPGSAGALYLGLASGPVPVGARANAVFTAPSSTPSPVGRCFGSSMRAAVWAIAPSRSWGTPTS